jgi:hypothetical protein
MKICILESIDGCWAVGSPDLDLDSFKPTIHKDVCKLYLTWVCGVEQAYLRGLIVIKTDPAPNLIAEEQSLLVLVSVPWTPRVTLTSLGRHGVLGLLKAILR